VTGWPTTEGPVVDTTDVAVLAGLTTWEIDVDVADAK
jgi:hypothetical protein